MAYTATSVELTLSADDWTAVPGDATLDGKVDVFDLAVLANNYGAGGGKGWTEADFSGNGLVNVFDLAELANNYGFGTGGSAALTAGGDPIPEPTALALLLLGVAATVRRRRRGSL